jgi:nanoRNase/pAp phosphatase (c-di-AMP/oligoRNAs hydrolase)
VVGGVVLGLVVLLGVLAGVRWVRERRRPHNRLRRVLGAVDAVTVLMHPNPDPDAMAAALGVAAVARSVDTQATVRYTGHVRHEQNRAMQRVLDLEFERFESVRELEGELVLVDHNEARGFAGAGGITPYAVVDHHPGDGEGRRFTDVRPGYGSCAAIVAEYLESLGWAATHETGVDEGRRLPGRVATALLFGIRTDTTGFTRGCTTADFEAASYVFPAADPEAMDRIIHPPVDEATLDVRARAVQYRRRVDGAAYSFDVDALSQAADELLRLGGVTAVVVAGEHDGTLHLSGRSQDDRVHMGRVLDEVVADIPMAEAGGHARMGGGQLSVAHMRGLGPSDGLSQDQLRDRVLDAVAANTGDR